MGRRIFVCKLKHIITKKFNGLGSHVNNCTVLLQEVSPKDNRITEARYNNYKSSLFVQRGD